MRKITPEEVKEIKAGECLVIPTNETGIHGAGLAKLATMKYELPYRFAFGMWQMTEGRKLFCIPTKDWRIKTLSLNLIAFYVQRFIECVKASPNTDFVVTKIGCGLAGYTPSQIAPMFRDCMNLENVSLPKEFWEELDKENSVSYGETLKKNLGS